MEAPKLNASSQQNDQVKNSAVSNSGTAINYNIQGDQHVYHPATLKTWTPPLMRPPCAQPFVGRDKDLAWLFQQLTDKAGRMLAICGPGGIGKTALAAEALNRFDRPEEWLVHFPDGIFYHSFYTYPSLAVAFEEIAHVFEEEAGADPRRAATRALSRRCALLVFDGVETLDDARPLRELGGKNVVLVLSRRQSDAPDLAHRLDLGMLPQEQAITLLQELAGPRAADRQSVEWLVQHIGGYPLALQLIGSYLSSRQEEVGDYLQWFKSAGLATLHHGEHQDQSVSVLLQRTYDSLASIEQHIYVLIGLLAPVPFPLHMIQDILELPEQAVRQALGSLVNLSVLRRPDLNYEVSHPMVHTFATERLLPQVNTASSPSSDIITTWRGRLLATLVNHFDQNNPYDRIALALWQPHVFPLLSAKHLTAEQSIRAARLFNAVGLDASIQGKYAEAEPLLKRALAIHEQQLGATHPNTASSLNNLAGLYRSQEKYAEAEPLLKRALTIREQQLGAAHPDTASSLNNLGEIYYQQGKYAEVEPLYQRALMICEQQLGAIHPDMAGSLSNLAELYQSQGKYAEAEPLFLQALAIYEQQLGATHPDTAGSLNNLALLYYQQGKYAEAEPLYQRALTIYKQHLGTTHPDTARSLNNLALLYEKQGKYAEAEPLYQQALAIYEQMGATHPDTARSLNNLVKFYEAQGKYAEAEPLYQRVLAIYEQMGATYPDTARSLNNLAFLYCQQDKYAEAEPLFKQALEICEQQLGTTHIDTARSLNNLAGFYYQQDKYVEAEPLYQRALAIYEQQLGATHLTTQVIYKNYVTLRQTMRRDAE